MNEADTRLVRPYVGSRDESGATSDTITKAHEEPAKIEEIEEVEELDWPTGEGREIRSHRRTGKSAAAETPPAPMVVEAPRGGKGRRIVTLAGAGALTVAVGVMATTGYMMFRTDSESALGRVPMPSGDLPPAAAPASGGLPAPASAAPSGKASGKAAGASQPATEKIAAHATPTARSTRPSPKAANGTKPAQPARTGTATTAPESLVGAPPAARVGVISDSGGLCLDLQDNIAADESAVQVFRCNTTSAQVWTLGADGTLRVHDRCVQGDVDAVWIDDCTGASAQWRDGGDGTLRNVGAGGCLNSPGRSLQLVRVTACSGAASQTWRLP